MERFNAYGIEWTEAYNVFRGQVGCVGAIVVTWEDEWGSKGYRVSFLGTILKARFKTFDVAMGVGVALAQKKLREALTILNGGKEKT